MQIVGNVFIRNVEQMMRRKNAPRLSKIKGLLNRLAFGKAKREEEIQEPFGKASFQEMLLQFLVKRGVKAVVFAFGNTAVFRDGLAYSLSEDYKDMAKRVRKQDLLLYTVSQFFLVVTAGVNCFFNCFVL